jgi:hypothetical protein
MDKTKGGKCDALRLVDKINRPEDRKCYIRELFVSWGRRCPQAAVAGYWSSSDPEAAARWAMQQLPAGKDRQ